MINAQDDWLAASAFPPLSVLGPIDFTGWLTPKRGGEIAYDVITLILYFNAIAENTEATGGATVAAAAAASAASSN